jgi:hypothetical protein
VEASIDFNLAHFGGQGSNGLLKRVDRSESLRLDKVIGFCILFCSVTLQDVANRFQIDAYIFFVIIELQPNRE